VAFLPEIGFLSLPPLADPFLFLDFLDVWKMENINIIEPYPVADLREGPNM